MHERWLPFTTLLNNAQRLRTLKLIAEKYAGVKSRDQKIRQIHWLKSFYPHQQIKWHPSTEPRIKLRDQSHHRTMHSVDQEYLQRKTQTIYTHKRSKTKQNKTNQPSKKQLTNKRKKRKKIFKNKTAVENSNKISKILCSFNSSALLATNNYTSQFSNRKKKEKYSNATNEIAFPGFFRFATYAIQTWNSRGELFSLWAQKK